MKTNSIQLLVDNEIFVSFRFSLVVKRTIQSLLVKRVGKTAIAEGLAIKMASGDVPES